MASVRRVGVCFALLFFGLSFCVLLAVLSASCSTSSDEAALSDEGFVEPPARTATSTSAVVAVNTTRAATRPLAASGATTTQPTTTALSSPAQDATEDWSYDFSSPFGEGTDSTMHVWSSRTTSSLTGYGESVTARERHVWLHVTYVSASGSSTGYELTVDGKTVADSARCTCARMEVLAGDIDFVVRAELADQSVEAQFKLRGSDLALVTAPLPPPSVPIPPPSVPLPQSSVPIPQPSVPLPQTPGLAEQLAFSIVVEEVSPDIAAVRIAAIGDAAAHRSNDYTLRFVPTSGLTVGNCPLLGAMLEIPEQCTITKGGELTTFPDTVGQLELLIDGLVVRTYPAALSLND